MPRSFRFYHRGPRPAIDAPTEGDWPGAAGGGDGNCLVAAFARMRVVPPAFWRMRLPFSDLRNGLLTFLAPLGRAALPRQVHGRVDKADVGERLREIAHQPLRLGVVFLRQQAHVVAQTQQPFVEPLGVFMTPKEVKIVREPERAGQEGALARRQAVRPRVRAVALHEAVVHQVLLDGLDGAANARVGGRQEADQRDHQQAGVEVLRAVILHEGAELRVEALFTDFPMDFVAAFPPAIRPGRPRRSSRRT